MLEPLFVGTLVALLLAAGLLLRMALRLAYGVRGPNDGDQLYGALRAVSWLLIGLGIALLTLASFFVLAIVLFVLIGAAVDYVTARRSLERELAWSLVGDAQTRGQSIPQMIQVLQDRFTGVVRSDLRGFAWQLRHGDPLPAALAVWHKAFPRDAQGYAALGKQDGRVPYNSGTTGSPSVSYPTGALGYLLWLVIAIVGIGGFVVAQILPNLTELFNDFSMDLPAATQGLIDFTGFGAAGLLALLTLLSLVLIPAAGVLLCQFFDIPVLDWITDRLRPAQRRAQVLRLLALAAERSTPLTQAMHDLAMGQPRFPAQNFANKLRRAYRSAVSGDDWKLALDRVGVLRSNELPLLSAAERAHNLPWALRALADRAEARSRLRWQAAGQLAFPLAIAGFGLLVMWVAVALFQPLVALISGLA